MMRKNKSTVLNHFGKTGQLKLNLNLTDNNEIRIFKRSKTTMHNFSPDTPKMLEQDIRNIDSEIFRENQLTQRKTQFEMKLDKQNQTIQMLFLKIQDIEDEFNLNNRKIKKIHSMIKDFVNRFKFYQSLNY